MSEQAVSPEALKKQDETLKQMKTLLAKLQQASSAAKGSAAQLEKALEAEKDD